MLFALALSCRDISLVVALPFPTATSACLSIHLISSAHVAINRAMQAPMLAACTGPRAFQIPTGREASPELLQEQTQARRALQLLEQARSQASSAPRIGAAYGDVRAARVQVSRARLQQTSASAAAAARLETVRTANAARSLQEAARTGQPLSLADASYFTGSHLVADDVDDALGRPRSQRPGTSQAATMPSSARGAVAGGSRPTTTARGASRISSTRGGAGSGWDRTPASSPLSEEIQERLTFSSRQSPRKRNEWSRRVEQRQQERAAAEVAEAMSAAAEGGDDAYAFAMEDLQRTRPIAAGSQSARGPRPSDSFSPYDSVASATAAAFADDADSAGNAAFDLGYEMGSPGSGGAQPWWTRLHNSENKSNSSPYCVGNKSVYYQTQQKRHQHQHQQQQQQHEESKESQFQQQQQQQFSHTHPSLPRIAAATAALPRGSMTARGGEHQHPPLRKLIHSSALDGPVPIAPAPASAATAHTSVLRALLSSAPAGFSHNTSSALGSSAFASGADAHSGPHSHRSASGGGGGVAAAAAHHHRQDLLSRNVRVKTLAAPAAGNLPASWAAQPQLLAWKRRADTMTLAPAPKPAPASAAAVRQLQSRLAHMTPYERELEQIRLIREANQRRGTKFQYDPVSELHGFLSQKNIKALQASTNYNRRELYVIYVRFKALCALSPSPHGIDKATFKKGVSRLAVEDDRFVNRVFSLVDDDDSGHIEWEEFLLAMSALEKGEPEAKTRFFFQIYDLDADGYISRADLSTMFHSSSMLDDDATTVEVVNTFVDKVFATFGASESGRISFDDVMRYMKNEGEREDVWDVFGRSMLQDFTPRPGH